MLSGKKRGLFIGSVVLIVFIVFGFVYWRNSNSTDNGNADPNVNEPVVELIYDNGEVKEAAIDDLAAFLQNTEKPVFIDFWAAWCPPCTAAAPFVKSLAAEYHERAHIVKVNVDYAAGIAAQYQVQSIPLFVLVQDNQAVDSQVGYNASLEDNLREMIDIRLP